MGAVDVERQALNVFRMKLLGAEVEAVHSGSRTLKDAVNEAMRDWVASVESTHYCLGSVMGPHPYPWMVREFHRVIGTEAREQCLERYGSDPDFVVACVGGGSNAIGIFSGFVDTKARLIGVEPAGGAAVGRGQPGVVHGMRSYLMQDEYGQVQVIEAFQLMAKTEGIIPALECAHALAWITREAPKMQGKTVLMNLSGRGDKDVGQMMEILG
jgi:tryptophan synthase beta chain